MGEKQGIIEVAGAIENLGRDLKSWNRHVFGNLNKRIKEETKKLERLEKRNPSIENITQLCDQKKVVNDLLQKQEIMWRQRSRID